MKNTHESVENHGAKRRKSKRLRAAIGFGVVSALTAVGVGVTRDTSAKALGGDITAISTAADKSGLQPATRLNPPNNKLANHGIYWIGDSLSKGIAQVPDANAIALRAGWSIIFNAVPSRSLFYDCGRPGSPSACATLSDGNTEIRTHQKEIAENCNTTIFLGENDGYPVLKFGQILAEDVTLIFHYHEADPKQTCPPGQFNVNILTIPIGGPHKAGFGATREPYNDEIHRLFDNVQGVNVVPARDFYLREGLQDNGGDNIHPSTLGNTKVLYWYLNYMSALPEAA